MKLKLKSILLNKRLLNIIFVFMIVFLLFTKKEKKYKLNLNTKIQGLYLSIETIELINIMQCENI